MTSPLGYQAVDGTPRSRCSSCRRWAAVVVVQGLEHAADDASTSRRLCARCAISHRRPRRDDAAPRGGAVAIMPDSHRPREDTAAP